MVMLAALFCTSACDEKDPTTDGSPAAVPRGRTVFGSGTIRGVVRFVGTPPPRAEIPNQPCHPGAAPLKEETVIVNGDGTLANVFVYLAGVPASDGSNRDAALLDQRDCRYIPHALGVQVGQTLRVRSSDAGTLHNVHYNPDRNAPANFGLTSAGDERKVKFDQAEFIRVRCDVHPWMNAYVGVFESPFFAVTSEQSGQFEIGRVPAGEYRLFAWHERYGTVEQRVTVKDNEKVDVTATFKPPGN